MALVCDGRVGPCSQAAMPRSRLVTCLRALAIIAAVWTVAALFSALSLYIRSTSGELTLSPGWYWGVGAVMPVWTVVAPPVLAGWTVVPPRVRAASRWLRFERRSWPIAVLGHVVAFAAVLAFDGLAMM